MPKAREAIKALVEDGRFDYLETGSLISIKKNVENIVIPSEEDGIDMYPMDFEEFLWEQSLLRVQIILQCTWRLAEMPGSYRTSQELFP